MEERSETRNFSHTFPIYKIMLNVNKQFTLNKYLEVVDRSTDKTMTKRKTLYRNLKSEQHKHHNKLEVKSSAPDG